MDKKEFKFNTVLKCIFCGEMLTGEEYTDNGSVCASCQWANY